MCLRSASSYSSGSSSSGSRGRRGSVFVFGEEDFPICSPRLASPPPPPPPGLARQPTTRAVFSDMEDSPPAVERLKPQPFRRKDPALHFQACVRGDLQELSKWVESGGDPNSRDEEGWALLHHATMHGREGCVQLLLGKGARHDMVSIGGHTVLHLASANRHSEVVKRLVDAGARVNVRNAHGNTPLHSAAATGTVDVLSYLLRQSANPDAVNSVGETPDQVCGASEEAIGLLQEARRLKHARIAQRFALVKIHKLWNSGRAEPRSGSGVLLVRGTTAATGAGPARRTDGISSGQAAAATATTIRKSGGDRVGEPLVELDEAAVKAAAATGAGGATGRAAQLEREDGRCAEEEGELTRGEPSKQQPSLESTVAGVAGLPQEVLRRIISYCTL